MTEPAVRVLVVDNDLASRRWLRTSDCSCARLNGPFLVKFLICYGVFLRLS